MTTVRCPNCGGMNFEQEQTEVTSIFSPTRQFIPSRTLCMTCGWELTNEFLKRLEKKDCSCIGYTNAGGQFMLCDCGHSLEEHVNERNGIQLQGGECNWTKPIELKPMAKPPKKYARIEKQRKRLQSKPNPWEEEMTDNVNGTKDDGVTAIRAELAPEKKIELPPEKENDNA